jgi:hypothetical protein
MKETVTVAVIVLSCIAIGVLGYLFLAIACEIGGGC